VVRGEGVPAERAKAAAAAASMKAAKAAAPVVPQAVERRVQPEPYRSEWSYHWAIVSVVTVALLGGLAFYTGVIHL